MVEPIRAGVAVAADEQVRLLLEAETPVVTIFGKTWLLHVKEVLRTSPEENLAMIADTVRFLKEHGKFVVYDAEHGFDGFKDNADYAMATWQAAEAAGADVVALCDTNGGSLPGEVGRITAAARDGCASAPARAALLKRSRRFMDDPRLGRRYLFYRRA